MKKVVELNFATLDVNNNYPTVYDETKLNVSDLFYQNNTGTQDTRGVGLSEIAFSRPGEASTAIYTGFPSVLDIGDHQHIFTAEIVAGTNRRILKHTYNKLTHEYTWDGFITLTMPAGNVSIRSNNIVYDTYTAGTVSVSSSSVTGLGSTWVSDNICVGSRIGFGSTDPTQISIWYVIQSVDSEDGITLTTPAPTFSAGTNYVIEDLKLVLTTTNATVTNGGLFLVKGLSLNDFNGAGTTIPLATTIDKLKAVYWLKDASTVTNTGSWGLGLDTKADWSNQMVYVVNGAVATTNVFVYNIRTPLISLSSGVSENAFMFKTGNVALLGTLTQSNGVTLGTLNHGPGNGVKSLYYVTSTRIYRSDLALITNGSTSWVSDVMVENPVGGTNSTPASSSLRSLTIIDDMDALFVETSNATSNGSYLTKYNTSGVHFDDSFFYNISYYQSTLRDGNVPMLPSSIGTPMNVCYSKGYLHVVRYSTSNLTHQFYSIPFRAHWLYDMDTDTVVTPSINISTATKLYNVYLNNSRRLGDMPFTLPYEPIRMYYRTTGISDNSGSWTLIDDSFNLLTLSPTSNIQFKIAFKVVGSISKTPLLHSLAITYEDDQTDSHYEPSVANSNIASRIFSWRQSISWGSVIPNMRIRVYNIATSTLILDDDTSTSVSGIWEYSNDGGSTWNSWDDVQDVVGNYIRYTASSLPSSVKTKVILTQL
jgi:hypothetical protein